VLKAVPSSLCFLLQIERLYCNVVVKVLPSYCGGTELQPVGLIVVIKLIEREYCYTNHKSDERAVNKILWI
jgi:hypothetical protein